ncbi:MAG: ABC transporter substrate-binding protein [Clostridia bacterium]|nr:ABC transporter substrate-binding protein [Clostridia bacterium]
MKNSRKVLSLILAALMLVSTFAFASCGKTDDGKAGGAYNIPIVCGETGMNDVCGVATYGVNYYNLGVAAGDMAADILLNGADVSAMPVQLDPAPALSVNTKVAGEIGFTIPEAVSSNASTGDTTIAVTPVAEAIVAEGGDFTVGILQLVQHVALDQSNKGFQDQLSVRMSEAGKTVTILDQNAAGDQSNCVTISESFVGQDVDLIYTIATSAAQSAAAATEESGTPVLFCAVTDPVSAGLVESMEVPGGNVSGVSDINPVADQIDLIAELLGKDDIKIGLLYTSSETNSVFQIGLAKAECDAKGYTYVDKGIGDINDIESAFIALAAEGVDAIYIPTDNVLANGAANVHSINIGG